MTAVNYERNDKSDRAVQIQLALRTAAGHERAALAAEAQALKTYEMKMISAGASVYEAFTLAVKMAPECQGRAYFDENTGRPIEKAIRRLYESTKPRPWWDAHLAKVKVNGAPATREWGKRLIQWHIDPEAAKARRAAGVLRAANKRAVDKVLSEKRNSATRGERRTPQAPTRREADRYVAAGTAIATAGREELPALGLADVHATREDCMGEINRIKSAVSKLKEPGQFDLVTELLKATAREIERLA